MYLECVFIIKVKAKRSSPSQSYGVPLATWDHMYHLTQVNTAQLNPSQTGDLPTLAGWKAELI